jgi:hypothetical protein
MAVVETVIILKAKTRELARHTLTVFPIGSHLDMMRMLK